MEWWCCSAAESRSRCISTWRRLPGYSTGTLDTRDHLGVAGWKRKLDPGAAARVGVWFFRSRHAIAGRSMVALEFRTARDRYLSERAIGERDRSSHRNRPGS